MSGEPDLIARREAVQRASEYLRRLEEGGWGDGDLRDAAACADHLDAILTTLQASDADTAMLRNVVSHATGGSLDIAEHPDIGVNAICVEISRFRNRLYADGIEQGRKEASHPKPEPEPMETQP